VGAFHDTFTHDIEITCFQFAPKYAVAQPEGYVSTFRRPCYWVPADSPTIPAWINPYR
jgi:hypothetical protein